MPRPHAADGPIGIAKGVGIAGQGGDRDKAFDEHLIELYEEAELRDGKDQSLEVVTYLVGHKLHLFPFDQLTLGVGGASLRLGAFGGDVGELRGRNRLGSKSHGFGSKSIAAQRLGDRELHLGRLPHLYVVRFRRAPADTAFSLLLRLGLRSFGL